MKSTILKSIWAALLLAAFGATSAVADIVYVTSTCSNATSTTVCASAINPDLNPNAIPVYSDAGGGFTSAISTKSDGPLTPGARFFSNSFSNSTPDIQGITIAPALTVPGGVYRLYHVFTSANGNVSLDILLGATNVENCTLSFNQTDKFQSAYGTAVSGKQVYQFLGWVTNNPGATIPMIRFYFKGGVVNSGAQRRLIVDTFKFALNDACLDIPVVSITGPLSASMTTVVVNGVSATATKITVYQDSGSGMTSIGTLTTGIVAGNNIVSISGLIKGAKIAATQTIGGIDGCMPLTGTVVGGGANPTVRLAVSIRETPSTGPVGNPGITTNLNIHFLGASTTTGGAPTDSLIIYPSNGWQTVTFTARTSIAAPTGAAGTPGAVVGGSYLANDSVAIQVYAYKSSPFAFYSATSAQSTAVTSANAFTVNWTWNAVAGADGYRLLRNVNGAGYNEYYDVPVNSYSDDNIYWSAGTTVTPTLAQTLPSIQWNAGTTPVGTTTIGTKWGILESLSFSIADSTDTGPYDMYIDNIQNGATVFQTFETAPAGSTDYGFRVPSFSGSTSGNLLAAPDVGVVTNLVSDTGTKAFRVQFQWQATTANKWLRLTTSGVNNPLINLDEPFSFRLLMQPTGATRPAAPAAPTISESVVGGMAVMDWTGGHRLQTSVNVAGTYTNVTQGKTTSNWTNIWNGNFLSPWTNTFTEPTRFFRLRD